MCAINVALQKQRYLISILHLIDYLTLTLVAEGYFESRIDIEGNKCNQRSICNTNAFIFSTCSYILCDGQENYSFCLEKKLYSDSY